MHRKSEADKYICCTETLRLAYFWANWLKNMLSDEYILNYKKTSHKL